MNGPRAEVAFQFKSYEELLPYRHFMSASTPPLWSSRKARRAWMLFPILAAWGAFALFANLGGTYLWGDEAETAMLAKSILIHGVPLAAIDGQAIRPEYPAAKNARGVWVWNTWLAEYLTAASFKVLGVSTFSARAPFALAGLLSLLLSALVFHKISRDSFTAWLGAALLATSVPYLLYMRQCHYYPLTALGTLGLLYATWSIQEGSRRGAALFAFSLAFLFHSFFPFSYGAAAAPVAWILLRPRHPAARRLLLGALGATACLCLPSFLYQKAWSRPPEQLQAAAAAWSHFKVFVLWINQFMFPGALLILLAAKQARVAAAEDGGRRLASEEGCFLAAFIFLPIVQFSIAGSAAHTRFIVGIFPAVFLALAMGLTHLAGKRRWVAAALAITLALSNGLHIFPTRVLNFFNGGVLPAPSSFTEAMAFKLKALPWACYPARFLAELTEDYDGPTEALMRYLGSHAKPGETLLTPSEALPARFYAPAGLRVIQTAEAGAGAPDWIAPTRWLAFDAALSRRILDWIGGGYETVLLPVPDLLWENHPDILYHHFRLPPTGKKILYRRIGPPGR